MDPESSRIHELSWPQRLRTTQLIILSAMLPATKHSFDSTCWRISMCPRCRPVTGWFGVLRWFSFSSWHGCSWWFALDNPRKATGKKDEKRKEHKPLHTKAVHTILHAFYFFSFQGRDSTYISHPGPNLKGLGHPWSKLFPRYSTRAEIEL